MYVSNDEIIELLLKHRAVIPVMRELGLKGTSNDRILKIGRTEGILKNKGVKNYEMKYEMVTTDLAKIELEKELEAKVAYKKIDQYKVQDKIKLGFNEWTIYAINECKRRIYHCINQKGFRESFDALELNKGYLTN